MGVAGTEHGDWDQLSCQARLRRGETRGDNDNDNDTLREVPHPSNEGLALQARVSGPWPNKKESVLLVYLARWQGVQVQTVRGQIVSQRDLRLTQCKKEMHSRIHVKVSTLKKKEKERSTVHR